MTGWRRRRHLAFRVASTRQGRPKGRLYGGLGKSLKGRIFYAADLPHWLGACGIQSQVRADGAFLLSPINANRRSISPGAQSMASKMWRQRLTYMAMSVFVAWHTLAMVVAPAPDSHVTQSLRALLQPYLTLFRLDNPWDFFAPTVGEGSRLRYVVEDAAGERHAFMPTEQLSWFHPDYFWFRAWYYAIIEYPELYADRAAARLCRKHAALHPVSITLLSYEEERLHTRTTILSGKHPHGSRVFHREHLKRVKCPASDVRPLRPRRVCSPGPGLVADLVSRQPDVAARARPHRHRRGAAAPLRPGNALSFRSLGRRRLDAARRRLTIPPILWIAIGLLLF